MTSVPFIGKDRRTSSRCERDSISSARQDSETSSRHNGCDKQPECTVVTDKPGNTSGNISSSRHKVIYRSASAVHRPLGLGVDF